MFHGRGQVRLFFSTAFRDVKKRLNLFSAFAPFFGSFGSVGACSPLLRPPSPEVPSVIAVTFAGPLKDRWKKRSFCVFVNGSTSHVEQLGEAETVPDQLAVLLKAMTVSGSLGLSSL